MKLAHVLADGSTAIFHAASKKDLERVLGPLTDEAYREHVLKRVEETGAVDIVEITEADIPKDRYFRNAWKLNGGKVEVDMPKAREIQRNEMRAWRKERLAELDIEYQRADESDDRGKKTEISAKKQALRDVTADPAIEAAQTPEELKAVWPEILNGK